MVLLSHAIIPCLAAIYTPSFSDFWHCHPYIFQHVMIVACYHPLHLSACVLHFDLVSILLAQSLHPSPF